EWQRQRRKGGAGKRHGPGASRRNQESAVAEGWHGLRTAAPQLRLPNFEEGGDWRAACGARGKTPRWKARRRRRADRIGNQDEGGGRDAEDARRRGQGCVD